MNGALLMAQRVVKGLVGNVRNIDHAYPAGSFHVTNLLP